MFLKCKWFNIVTFDWIYPWNGNDGSQKMSLKWNAVVCVFEMKYCSDGGVE